MIGACVCKRDVVSGVARALVGHLEAPAGAGDVHAVFDQVAAGAFCAVRYSDRLLGLGRRGRTCLHGTVVRRDLRVPDRGVVVHSRGWAIAGQAARPIRHRPVLRPRRPPTRARPHGHSSQAGSAQQAALVAQSGTSSVTRTVATAAKTSAGSADEARVRRELLNVPHVKSVQLISKADGICPAIKARSPGRPAS